MPNVWIEALKEYNMSNNKKCWCIPKRNTESYEKIQRIRTMRERRDPQQVTRQLAASKIQGLARGVQYRERVRNEKAAQALERYKHLIPQSSISNMMKQNETFPNNELYIWNQIREENKNAAIRKQKLMSPAYSLMRK